NNGTSVALAAGTVPASGSCTVTVNVTSATAGSYLNNTGNVTTTNAGTVAGAAATLTVLSHPTIAKAFAPTSIAPNAPSVLTITLTNPNVTAITGAAFTDSYPAGMANTATPSGATTCAGGTVTAANGGNNVSLSSATIPASGSCTVTVNVTATAAGTYVNTIPAGALTTANAGANTAPASATLNAFNAPTVTKTFAPTSIPSGGTATMTIVVANPGANPGNLTSATISDAYPAGLTNAAAGGVACTAGGSATLTGGANGGTTVGFNAGVIPAGGSCTITQTVSSNASALNTTSTATSTQAPPGAAASATLSVAGSPAITKAFAPASIPLGATSTVTFTISNPNAIALTNGAFTDTLAGMVIDSAGAAGGTCAGAGGNVFVAGQTSLTFTGLAIPASLSCNVTVVVRGTAVGVNPNTASGVSSTQAATGAASNTANLTVTASAPSIAKAFAPATIDPGAVSVLTITISNGNAAAITVTSVTDTYPAGITTSGTPNTSTTCAGGVVTSAAGSVTLAGGVVPGGGSCSFSVDVTSVTPGVSPTNTIPIGALTTSAGSNVVAANATLNVRPEADLAVTKSGPATIVNGAPIAYTVVVSNAGPQAGSGAQFTDNVPAVVAGVAAACGSPTGGAVCGAVGVAGNSVTSTITTLPAGGSVTFTITGTAPQSGTFTNTARVVTPISVTDPTDPGRTGAGNNSASANTTVVSPDLRVSKSHAGNFTVGINGVYTITVDNTLGTAATSGAITVTDTLPTGLTYVSATGTGWACGAAGQIVTCTTAGALAAGATSANPITLIVAVASVAVPSVINSVTVSGGNEPAANNGNNTAFDPTNVANAAVNAFAPDNMQAGSPGTSVFYAHTFNAGSAGSVAFSTTNIATPAVAGWTQAIYRDSDCSGSLNGAEGAAPMAGAVAVVAGDVVCIIVRDNIPAAAPFNAQNVITVTATFNGSQTYTRTDTTTVGAAAGAGLTIAKAVRNVTQGTPSATSNTGRPNDVLEYALTYTNTGSGPVSAIVITDATPTFTTFLAASCNAPLPGNITSCTVTSQPAVNGTGSVVWTLAGSLLPGGTGTVIYTVRIIP
ncbi:MAG: beta strand repeat-containing protein, partial [Usitatibacter sp.]